MKKLTSLLLILILQMSIALGYTVKTTVREMDLVITGEEGNIIDLERKDPAIVDWRVLRGNVTIDSNDRFTMPAEDVEIEAILQYTVTLNNHGATTPGTTSVVATYKEPMPAITPPQRVYTVTYNYNGGTGSPASQTVTDTFNGYYKSENGGGTKYYNANGSSANNWDGKNDTIHAYWTDATVTLPTPTRENYTFQGWATSNGGAVVYSGGQTIDPSSNMNLYAVWGLYGDADNDGDVDVDDVNLAQDYIADNTTVINIKNTDVNVDGVINKYDLPLILELCFGPDAIETPYTGKVVIFEYNYEGATTTYGYQLFATGETKALAPSGTWTREIHVLNGWATSSTGNVVYAPGANFTANANTTLYAKWGLYGDANDDGIVNMQDSVILRQKDAGQNVTINPINADVNADGNADIYDAYIILRYFLGIETSGYPYKGKVLVYRSNNEDKEVTGYCYTAGATATLADAYEFEDGEYVINGWAETPTGAIAYAPGASYTVNENKTFYAVWGLYGDANNNGTINTADTTIIAQYSQGGNPTINLINSDVNLDGVVDMYDHFIIRYYLVDASLVSFPYTGKVVIFDDNYEAGAGQGLGLGAQLFATGETKALDVNTFTRDGYAFQGWATSADGGVVYADGANFTANNNATLYAVWGEEAAITVNAPVLGAGMKPVNWNGSSWVETTVANWDWNYTTATAGHNTVAGDGTAKWANAMIDADGDGVLESSYVWIPRYSYKIESGYHQDVDSWSSVDTPGTGKIVIKFSNGTEDEVTEGATDASQGYIAHPAFTFGDDELTGIWVAKYEASRNDANSTSEGTGAIVTVRPEVKSLQSISVSTAYEYSYNLNRNLDSHLMRNSEWGAVAYLTNAIGKIPYINNSNTYITGNAGGSQDAASASGITNAWNTAGGVKGSTTHNVYGIYDLSGGVGEYASAYYTGGSSTYLASDISNKTYAGSLYTNRDTKYVEVYNTAYSNSIRGDAIYETSSSGSGQTAWDGDWSGELASDSPVLNYGGSALYTRVAGLFCFSGNDGKTGSIGFRPVLAVKPPPKVNEPLLGEGMTPVNWNGTEWVATTEDEWDWNYSTATAGHETVEGDGTAKWANAMIDADKDGTPESYYVWIPRYSYKIESGNHQDVDSWSSVDTPGTGKILVKFSDGVKDYTSDGYLSHPAFTFGYDDLTGIWVAKYEASRKSATSSSKGTDSTANNIATSRPGVRAWTNLTASDAYAYAYNLDRNLDSHLMKNSEWGAVAYLTNAIGKIPYINNSSIYLTGKAGTGQNAGSSSGTSTGLWNTAEGVKASTTHNIYGIYDMSGGADEFVSALYKNGGGANTTNMETDKNTKYVELYLDINTDGILGDAMYETSSQTDSSGTAYSWDGDNSAQAAASRWVINRGGCYVDKAKAGIFAYSFESSGVASNYDGFRPVLAVKQPATPPNTPILGEGMTPVNWNGTEWVDSNIANWEYNYDIATAGHGTVEGDGTGKWANAKTADGSMWVWIPRYSYKIESGYHETVNSWSSVDAPGTGKIKVKFSKGSNDDTSDGYLKHPAFTFGTDELTGIWVAKYEASRNDATSSSLGSGTTVTSKPGVKSWSATSITDIYEYSYNLNRTLDSHLMRNSEWEAIAYLTNAIGKIPYINNCSSFTTGNAGGSQDASSASGITNAWNTAGGVKASTTHNVYGIYDMSGGRYEYVSAYYTGANKQYLADDATNKTYAGILYANRNTKYVETYDTSSTAEYNSWDGDSKSASISLPAIARGGYAGDTAGAGIFYLNSFNPTGMIGFFGFRPVLAIPLTTENVTYNANGGTFDTGTTNVVKVAKIPGSITKISKTSNVSDDGSTYGSGYDANLSTTDVVTIPGATSLSVTITYQTYSSSTDWVCVYDNSVTPSSSNYSSSISGKLYGRTSQTTQTYTITGDTVQFYFKSNSSNNGYYGYYATVTADVSVPMIVSGTYKEPTKPDGKIIGWNTNSSSTTVEYPLGEENVPTEAMTLYAVWACPICDGTQLVPESCATCDGTGAGECSSCGGDGDDIVDCSRCGGSGDQDCTVCGGSGDNGSGSCGKCGSDGTITCQLCDGAGEREDTCEDCGGDGTKAGACDDCSGTGIIYVQCPNCTLTCPECEGRGTVVVGDPCHECGGDGDDIVECSRCGGSGDQDCTVCGGSGDNGSGSCGKCGSDGTITCQLCDGEGEREDTCEECGGDGGTSVVACPRCSGSGFITDFDSVFIITFNKNDGSGTMKSQTFDQGVTKELRGNTFTRDGYSFVGWSTTADGSVAYTNRADYTANGNATLYAVWRANITFTISTVNGTMTYKAYEGMTWAQWCSSEYSYYKPTSSTFEGQKWRTFGGNSEGAFENTIVFKPTLEVVYTHDDENTYALGTIVRKNEVIKAGYAYAGSYERELND